MLKNVWVRIAIIVVLAIVLYYLVVMLARNTADTDDASTLFGGAESLAYATPTTLGSGGDAR